MVETRGSLLKAAKPAPVRDSHRTTPKRRPRSVPKPRAIPSTPITFSKSLRKNPPRPPNCWILYRGAMNKKLALLNPDDSGKTLAMQAISGEIAEMWHNETPEVIAHYKDLAARADKEHKLKYPGYRYKPGHPKSKGKSGSKKGRSDDDDEEEEEEDQKEWRNSKSKKTASKSSNVTPRRGRSGGVKSSSSSSSSATAISSSEDESATSSSATSPPAYYESSPNDDPFCNYGVSGGIPGPHMQAPGFNPYGHLLNQTPYNNMAAPYLHPYYEVASYTGGPMAVDTSYGLPQHQEQLILAPNHISPRVEIDNSLIDPALLAMS